MISTCRNCSRDLWTKTGHQDGRTAEGREKQLTIEEWSETEEGKWLKISQDVNETRENHKTL